jgi:hypothetical protein
MNTGKFANLPPKRRRTRKERWFRLTDNIQTTPDQLIPTSHKGAEESDPWFLPVWFVQHILLGAMTACLAVVLFYLLGPVGFLLKYPRPFPPWQSAGMPILGGTLGALVAFLAWRSARKNGAKLDSRFTIKSMMRLVLIIVCGSFLYGYFAPRATATSLRLELATTFPYGASKGQIMEWIHEQRGIQMCSAPAALLYGGTAIDVCLVETSSFFQAPNLESGLSIAFTFDAADQLRSINVREKGR